MSKVLIFFFLSVVSIFSIASEGGAHKSSFDILQKHYYDLLSACGFSFSSERTFVYDEKICGFIYQDKTQSPFFYGSVSSNKEYLTEKKLVGAIRLSEESPMSTRTDYYDAQRDVTQHQVRSQKLLGLTEGKRDIVIVSELEVTYDKPDKSGQILTPVKEIYECWDGVLYGKTTAISLALCSLGSARNSGFASQKSWQAEVIKSLSVE